MSQLQWNFNDSSTDGSSTVADSNLILCPKEILLIAQETNI